MPFCGYCYNLKYENYTDHYLRADNNKNSKIICPILLKTKCNYCNDLGHTVSYCPLIEKLNQKKISSALIEYNKLTSSIFNKDPIYKLVCN